MERKPPQFDYEADIRIDESALDIEWLEQASLMFKYAKNAALMKKKVDLAREKLDIVRAEVDKKIRENPGKYDIEKVTEGGVAAAILRHEDYQEANSDFINVKYNADMAIAAARCIDSRKDALENLVRLHGQQYFAGPRVPRNIEEERILKNKHRNSGVSKSLNNRDDN